MSERQSPEQAIGGREEEEDGDDDDDDDEADFI
jgi:hypothetical protein